MFVIELQSSYHLSHDCDISFRQPDRVRAVDEVDLTTGDHLAAFFVESLPRVY